MMVIGFLVFVLLVIGIIYVIKLFFYTAPLHSDRLFRRQNGDKEPLDILKRRYANGEIEREDYERMKKDLENK